MPCSWSPVSLCSGRRSVSIKRALAALGVAVLWASCATLAGAAPAVWCSTQLVSDTLTNPNPSVAAYQRAHAELCAGDAKGAAAGLAAILPTMESRYKNDGTTWIDFGRSYVYALIASGNADGARRFLTALEGGAWKPSSAERLFWNESYAGSFAAYIADDTLVQRSPDNQAAHKLDPHLPAALQALRSNRIDDAITNMQAVRDTGSLYALMLGNLYAQKRDWPAAFAAWISAAAAGPDTPAMEFYTLDQWNMSALEMIYYYRAHAGPGTASR
jgi:hypothetical protein